MAESITENKSPAKKILKIILKTFLVLLGLLVLFIIGVFATAPLFDKFDHDRFITLDTQMQGIFQKLETASSGVDDWKYSSSCEAEHSGDWPTGRYFCSVTISLDKPATSVETVNNLQSKYYPIIDNDSSLKKNSELEKMPNDFGKNFIVSSLEKKYNELNSKISCDYFIILHQKEDDTTISSDDYGSYIANNLGGVEVSLKCTEIARGDWYL